MKAAIYMAGDECDQRRCCSLASDRIELDTQPRQRNRSKLRVPAYVLASALAYRRVPPRANQDFEFWMEVPEIMVSESGTAAYLRIKGKRRTMYPRYPRVVSQSFHIANESPCGSSGAEKKLQSLAQGQETKLSDPENRHV